MIMLEWVIKNPMDFSLRENRLIAATKRFNIKRIKSVVNHHEWDSVVRLRAFRILYNSWLYLVKYSSLFKYWGIIVPIQDAMAIIESIVIPTLIEEKNLHTGLLVTQFVFFFNISPIN